MAVVGASGLLGLQTAVLSQCSPFGTFATICEAVRCHPTFKLRGQLSQIQIRRGFVLLPTAPVLQKTKQRLGLSQPLSGALTAFPDPHTHIPVGGGTGCGVSFLT